MSELAGFADTADWLPRGVARRMAVEDQRERREARDAERARAERQDKAQDGALAAYKAAAEQRGEEVTAMQLATGQGIGRGIQDVFADAIAAASREDARAASRERRENGEVVFIDEPVIHGGASRSVWPEAEREVDRLVRHAQDDRSWMAAYQMRLASRRGQAAEHIEAMRRDRPASATRIKSGPGTEITRYVETPRCDACGYVYCKCR